ncbi:S-adenosyl-L-methionine-dependent methyltransferase [Bisporella sp. PMI_857]|nr:S-adenosyl-L-methionine-dependent methyltransferase [Bisporella sp. PMI_857]
MSVNSSVFSYVEENGMTYHRYKDGKYMLPNHESEMDRLDLQHQLWLLTLHDALFLSPVENPHNILDIGTGTGIWAIEVANNFPSAHVVGTDLSPIQPAYVPPNCHFEVDDFEDEWDYTQKFDLVHGRAMVTCFKDPLGVITSAFNSLRPGGYLELQDLVLPMRCIDDSLEGTKINEWQTRTLAAAAKMGHTWKVSGFYSQYLEEAGFVDVVEQHLQWPMNRWPKGAHLKTIGSYFQEDMTRGLENLSMAALTRGAGMTMEQVLELTTEAKKDLADKRIHAYCPIIIVYGRKPE